MNTPTVDQLKRALVISEQIEALQAELKAIFGDSTPASVSKATPKAKTATAKSDGRKAKKSPETIAKMRAAQQARYAKLRGAKATAPAKAKAEAPAAAPKKKGGMSPAHKAKLKAAAKKRWAAIRAGKAPNPFASKG